MDNYDVVIEKTVRDLFKSSKLNQIKKLKILKDTEINKKDEDLRSLILEKYPILIQSISSLEKISLNVSDLHSIRKNLGVNVNKIQNNIELNNFYKFSIADKLNEEFDEKFTSEDENIQEEIEKCQNLLNEKEFDSLLISMINLKKSLENYLRNSSKKEDELKYSHLREEYEFVLVDYMEILMKNFIQNNFYSGQEKIKNKSHINNVCQWNLTKFFLHIFGVFHLIYDKDKLNFSYLYLKLKKEKNIQEIYENIFTSSKGNFMTEILSQITSDTQNKNFIRCIIFTFECLIKLELLKLSKFIHPKSENSKNKLRNNFPEIMMNTYIVTILIDSIKYLNKKDEDDSRSESNSDYDSDGNSSDYEISEAKSEFNLKKIIKEIALIFSLSNDLIDINLSISNEQSQFSMKNSIRNFLIIIKEQINLKKEDSSKNQNTDCDSLENLDGDEDTIFKQLINSGVYQLDKKLEGDRDMHKYLCSNMLDVSKPKLATINKIIIDVKPDLVIDSLNDANDPYLLFNFLFLESLSERIQCIIDKEFEKITSENLRKIHKHQNIDMLTNFQKELKIEKIFKEIAELEISRANFKNTNILLNSVFRNILNSLMKNYLEDHIIKIKTKTTFISQDVNFLIKTFSNKTFTNYIKKLEFFECLDAIRVIRGVFNKNQIEEVKSYMITFKHLIVLENYLDEDCYNESDMFSNCFLDLTNNLNKNFNYTDIDFIDDKTDKTSENSMALSIKLEILEIIIKCYTDILQEFNLSSLNKRIKNDLYALAETFKKLSLDSQTCGETSESASMISLIEKKYLNIYAEDNCNYNNENNSKKLEGEGQTSSDDFQNFFVAINNSKVNINEQTGDHSRLLSTSNLRRKVFNEDYLLLPSKIPTPDLTGQLNPFLIKKTSKNNQQQGKKPTNNAPTNSISKLLVLSIDSNYVSLKSPSQSSVNHTPQVVNKPASNSIAHKSNGEKKHERHTPNDINSSTRDSNVNIKGYLGYFGGMLKDLSNLTGIKTNLSNEAQQNSK